MTTTTTRAAYPLPFLLSTKRAREELLFLPLCSLWLLPCFLPTFSPRSLECFLSALFFSPPLPSLSRCPLRLSFRSRPSPSSLCIFLRCPFSPLLLLSSSSINSGVTDLNNN